MKKRIIRHSTAAFLFLAGCISVVLFSVKYQVQDLEEKRASLFEDIRAEKQSIHVLRSEWSFLNDPARIGEMSATHLGMGVAQPRQMAAGEIIASIPVRAEEGGDK